MTLIFKELIGNKCLIYVDDILIFGRNKEEHNKNLNEVLGILKKYNLKENVDKRVSCKECVEFLGYEISYNKIKPKLDRSQGIMSYPIPDTKKKLQKFLGMINYDRRFIEGITGILSPLYKLLEQDKKFIWTEKHTEAVNKIKNKIKETLELTIPNLNAGFTLETDASNVGLGAVLKQNNQAIAYISRMLGKAEQNYSVTEKEVLAALWAMERFRYYLYGRRFKLVTDHKAIEEIKNKKEFGSGRIARWFKRLEDFDFEVEHKEGKKMIVPDALSRAPGCFKKINAVLIAEEEKILSAHKKLNHRKNILNELKEINIDISKGKLARILDKCIICLRKDKKRGRSCKHIMVDGPGARMGFDILEISHTERVVLGIDYYSRKLFGKMLNTKEAHKVVKFLDEVYTKFPYKTMITDNGREFDNEAVRKWAEKKNVKHMMSVPYYHQSNGRIERANRTIREACKKTPGMTKIKLKSILDNYNNIMHRGIGCTPNEALDKNNRNKVSETTLKYSKEFKRSKQPETKFNIGDKVLLRNELKISKMDDEFKERGTILQQEHGDVYIVMVKNGDQRRRHASQLKRLEEREVGFNDESKEKEKRRPALIGPNLGEETIKEQV